jgi:hypothetical protein
MLKGNGPPPRVEQRHSMSDLARAESSSAATVSVLPLGLGERIRAWAPLALVIATFLAVSTVYNLQVPLYEAPDEIAHARYVRTVADEGKLPGFNSSAEYESWQPPLYYVVGAAALTVLSLDTPPELEWNPNSYATGDSQNFLHKPTKTFPTASRCWPCMFCTASIRSLASAPLSSFT